MWDSRDFWEISDPGQRVVWDQDPKRWTHINSISIGDDGNFILSSRSRHQVFSVSPDYQTIAWQLGDPNSDYSFPAPGDRFHEQHTASQLPNGNILVFDNKAQPPDAEAAPYSRALELRLDHDNGSAVKVWEYRYRPDIYSRIISSAFRLDNGNTLVNFGHTQIPGIMPLAFIETDPKGNNVFQVETYQTSVGDRPPLRYRVSGDVAAIMGETMLRPPADRPAAGGDAFDDWQLWPFRELDTWLAGARPVASDRFDLYLDHNRIAYRKEQCAAGETTDMFFLHIFPANPADLPEESREFGFDNLDFAFDRQGIIRDEECLAAAPLPNYPIARIRTGQYDSDGERLWQAEFPAP